jgi:hypothetical protein
VTAPYGCGGTQVLREPSSQDVTRTYPEVAAALAGATGRRTLILDGEVTAFGGTRSSFSLLQGRLHVTRPSPLYLLPSRSPTSLYLLRQAGWSLRRSPYALRLASPGRPARPTGGDSLGAVGSGFAQVGLGDLTARLLSLEQSKSPTRASPPPGACATPWCRRDSPPPFTAGRARVPADRRGHRRSTELLEVHAELADLRQPPTAGLPLAEICRDYDTSRRCPRVGRDTVDVMIPRVGDVLRVSCPQTPTHVTEVNRFYVSVRSPWWRIDPAADRIRWNGNLALSRDRSSWDWREDLLRSVPPPTSCGKVTAAPWASRTRSCMSLTLLPSTRRGRPAGFPLFCVGSRHRRTKCALFSHSTRLNAWDGVPLQVFCTS